MASSRLMAATTYSSISPVSKWTAIGYLRRGGESDSGSGSLIAHLWPRRYRLCPTLLRAFNPDYGLPLPDAGLPMTAADTVWPDAIALRAGSRQSGTSGSELRPDDPRVVGQYTSLGDWAGRDGRGVPAARADGSNVALKVLRPEYAHDSVFLRRLALEGKLARRVDATYTAPVIAAVTDTNSHSDGIYRRPTLGDYVARNGPLSSLNAKALAMAQ